MGRENRVSVRFVRFDPGGVRLGKEGVVRLFPGESAARVAHLRGRNHHLKDRQGHRVPSLAVGERKPRQDARQGRLEGRALHPARRGVRQVGKARRLLRPERSERGVFVRADSREGGAVRAACLLDGLRKRALRGRRSRRAVPFGFNLHAQGFGQDAGRGGARLSRERDDSAFHRGGSADNRRPPSERGRGFGAAEPFGSADSAEPVPSAGLRRDAADEPDRHHESWHDVQDTGGRKDNELPDEQAERELLDIREVGHRHSGVEPRSSARNPHARIPGQLFGIKTGEQRVRGLLEEVHAAVLRGCHPPNLRGVLRADGLDRLAFPSGIRARDDERRLEGA